MAFIALLPMIALIVALSLLFSLLLYPLFKALFHRLFVENHELKIIEFLGEDGGKDVTKIIKSIGFRAAIEMSVHHLGKKESYYIIVPKTRLDRAKKFLKNILPEAKIKEVEDYQLFNYFGTTLAKLVAIESDEDIRNIDFGKIDFSKVNEVGEGAVVQIVHTPRMPGSNFEIRILASAPSEYQAKEIMDTVSESGFEGMKIKDPKDKVNFIHTVNFREHSFKL
jgi:predicted RNA binding protein YcfA (HicA-like mRNA interferase family)